MKLFFIALLAVFVSGCAATVPVTRQFPDIPPSLQQPCDDLASVPESELMSDMLSVVTANYARYHECSLRVDTWLEWYKTQSQLFDDID